MEKSLVFSSCLVSFATEQTEVDGFISEIQTTNEPPPVLIGRPIQRRSRLAAEPPAAPWRSKRLAKKAQGQPACPYVRASNVLLRKLGFTSDTRPPNAEAIQEMEESFTETLTASQLEGIRELFAKGTPTLELDEAVAAAA